MSDDNVGRHVETAYLQSALLVLCCMAIMWAVVHSGNQIEAVNSEGFKMINGLLSTEYMRRSQEDTRRRQEHEELRTRISDESVRMMSVACIDKLSPEQREKLRLNYSVGLLHSYCPWIRLPMTTATP
jgi:hypothetical protein